MKSFRIGVVVMLLAGIPVPSWGIEGYSGTIWGIGIYDLTNTNPRTQGSIRQGIDWFKRYELTFSTYGQFRYRFERDEAQFFNAYGPSLGMSISRNSLRLGLEHEWERMTGLGETRKTTQVFFEWWHGWDLKNIKR